MTELDRAINNNHFLDKINRFAHLLNLNGFKISIDAQEMALKSFEYIDLENQNIFYFALRSIFVKNHLDFKKFKRLFLLYWKFDFTIVDESAKTSFNKPKLAIDAYSHEENVGLPFRENSNSDNNTDIFDISYSLNRNPDLIKDVEKFSSEEMLRAFDYLNVFVTQKLSRRIGKWRITHKRKKLDIRKTIQSNFRNGGEIVRFFFRNQKLKPLPILMIVDVSRSMKPYVNISLGLMWVVKQVVGHKFTGYVFSSKIVNVTRIMETNNISEFVSHVQNLNLIGSGTRLSGALSDLRKKDNFKFVSKPLFVIISDGLGADSINKLDSAMKEIKNKSSRIIWANPLSGHKNYSLETKSLSVIKKYIKMIYPSNSIQSMLDLVKLIILSAQIA